MKQRSVVRSPRYNRRTPNANKKHPAAVDPSQQKLQDFLRNFKTYQPTTQLEPSRAPAETPPNVLTYIQAM